MIQTADALPGRVLLVDDDHTLLHVTRRVLAAAGFHVVTCEDGDAAVDAIRTQSFDAVVSDITMPSLSGIALLRAVRQKDLDLPVILVTGAPSVESAVEAIDLGVFKYLMKPTEAKVLTGAVGRAVHLYRLALAKHEALSFLGSSAGRTSDRVGLGAALDRSIELLWPAFQPIVSARGGALFGFEALLRSDEPSLRHPGVILDAAERLGRLDVLGRTMRERATAKLLESDPNSAQIFLNLHPQDLLDGELLNPDTAICQNAKRIVLEVTERATLDKIPAVPDRVASLREAGYRIAIDDLGAGYAGLTSFVQLEPEFVKLDMGLVRDVDRSRVKQNLVRSMTRLSQDMGLLVVAEGIETAEERDTLIELGCDLLQGYRFGRPSRTMDVPAW